MLRDQLAYWKSDHMRKKNRKKMIKTVVWQSWDTVEPRYSAPAFNEFRSIAHDFKSPIFFFFISLLSYPAFSAPAISENSGNSVWKHGPIGIFSPGIAYKKLMEMKISQMILNEYKAIIRWKQKARSCRWNQTKCCCCWCCCCCHCGRRRCHFSRRRRRHRH